jgi:hypothetical protein
MSQHQEGPEIIMFVCHGEKPSEDSNKRGQASPKHISDIGWNLTLFSRVRFVHVGLAAVPLGLWSFELSGFVK